VRRAPGCTCSATTTSSLRASIQAGSSSVRKSLPFATPTRLPLVKLQNDTLLRALLRQPTEYTPGVVDASSRALHGGVQRATRKRAGSFLGLAKIPRVRDGSHDAAGRSLSARCGDPLLRHPHRAGRDGPRSVLSRREKVRSSSARCEPKPTSRALAAPDPHGELRYVTDAVREICKALAGRIPLIGFSGSPFTLALLHGRGRPVPTTSG